MENEREVSANLCAARDEQIYPATGIAAMPCCLTSLAELPEPCVTRGGNMRAFLRQPSMLHQFKQSCALCGQWVASFSKMKNHYHRSHANSMNEHATQTNNFVTRKATACSTCHFCGGNYNAWRLHLHTCTVAWQCAVMCLYQEHGHGRRTVEVLRKGSGPSEWGSQSCQKSKAGGFKNWRTKREKTGARNGQDGGLGQVLSTPSGETRRGASGSHTRLFVCDVGAARGEHSATGAIRNGAQTEGPNENSSRIVVHASADDHGAVIMALSLVKELRDRLEALRKDPAILAKASGMATRQQGMEVPEMEHAAHQASRGGSGEDPSPRRGDEPDARQTLARVERWHVDEASCNKMADRKHGESGHIISRGLTRMKQAQDFREVLNTVLYGSWYLQAGGLEKKQPRPEGHGVAQWVLQVQLGNRGNYCYMKSALAKRGSFQDGLGHATQFFTSIRRGSIRNFLHLAQELGVELHAGRRGGQGLVPWCCRGFAHGFGTHTGTVTCD